MNTVSIRLFVGALSFAIGITAVWIPDRLYYGANYSPFADCSFPVNERADPRHDISLVYYAVLNEQFREKTPWVVEEMTHGGGRNIYEQLDITDIQAAYDTKANYRVNNSMSFSLRQAIDAHKDVMLYTETDEAEVTTLLEEGFRAIDWDKFGRRYRGSQQKIVFSDIGFNTRRDQALVYVYNVCHGGFCVEGSFFLLEKKNHQWYVTHKRLAWIA